MTGLVTGMFRVGDTYYASASTMHYSPGAPVIRSYDLVNREIAGRSVPVLDFGAKYDLDGARGYVRGIRASSPASSTGSTSLRCGTATAPDLRWCATPPRESGSGAAAG
jgi:hypothetical protein